MTNEDMLLQGKDPRFAKMFAKKGMNGDAEKSLLSETKKGPKDNTTLVQVESMLDQTQVSWYVALMKTLW